MYLTKVKDPAIMPPISQRATTGFVFYKIKFWWDRKLVKRGDEKTAKTFPPCLKNWWRLDTGSDSNSILIRWSWYAF